MSARGLIQGYLGGGNASGSQDRDNDVRVVSFKGASTIQTGQVPGVGSATPAIVATENPKRRFVAVRNIGANPVFVGDENVTPTTGFPIATTDPWFPMETTAQVYAICAAGLTTDLAWYAEVDF